MQLKTEIREDKNPKSCRSLVDTRSVTSSENSLKQRYFAFLACLRCWSIETPCLILVSLAIFIWIFWKETPIKKLSA